MRREDGFTLLEVLVALAILALALSAIYQAFAGGLQNETTGRRYAGATILAESRLAGIGAEYQAQTGHWTGTTQDGYRWSVEMRPMAHAVRPVDSHLPQLLEVEVRVLWDQGAQTREVRLKSLRLGGDP